MADFSEINQEINEQINSNGQRAITGAKLNEVLRDMISSVDENKMDMVEIDTVPTEDSTHPVESGGVYEALQGKVNVISVFGIQNLTEEQVNSLRAGDVVVDTLKKTKKAYTVSTENARNVDLVMVSDSTIIVCRYIGGVYQDTVEIDIAQKASEFVEGNVVSFDENGDLSDSGIASSDVATQSTTPKIYTYDYIDQLTSEQVEALKIGDIVVANHSDYGFLSAYNVTYKDDGECWIETPFNGDGYQVSYVLDNVSWIYVGTEIVSLNNYMAKSTGATVGNLPSFALNGDVSDSGYKPSDFATAAQGAKADTAYQKPSTGIPSSDIASGVIPDVSQFITKSVNDLTNYYLKSETYTQAEVNALIGAIQQFHYEIYATLPQTGQGNVLYLIGPTGSGSDRYEEYVYANNDFTKIGDTSIDLSGYVTTSALSTALSAYTTTSDLTTLLAGKLNAPATAGTSGQVLTSDGQGGQSWQTPQSGGITDVTVGGTSVVSGGVAAVPSIPTVPTISTNIASDATSDTKTTSPKAVKTFVEGKGYGTYSKPQGGIPESDLSSDVQQALQNHFKGWYASSSALPSNPIVGDYAYVKGASSADPVAIYECTTAGSWSDSGRTADTSNVQTFASGEEVNEVSIEDTPTEDSKKLITSGAVYPLFMQLHEQRYVDISSDIDGYIASYVAKSNSKIYAGNGNLNYKLMSEDTTIRYRIYGAYTSIGYRGAIPANNGTMTHVIAVGTSTSSGFSGITTIPAGQYLCWKSGGVIEKVVNESLDVVDKSLLVRNAEEAQLKDTKSMLLADVGTVVGWFQNNNKNIAEITTSTQDSITLPEGYNKVSISQCLYAVKHNDGTYGIHLFSAPADNVITIVRRGYDDEVDLSDVVAVQGVYDTDGGGNGQHLSAFGYLGLAKYVVDSIKQRDSLLQDNLVGGFNFSELGSNSTGQSGYLYKEDATTILYKPIYSNEAALYNKARVYQDETYNSVYDCFKKHYVFNQSTENASVEFELNKDKRMLGNGYVVIRGGLYSATSGSVRVDILQDGVSVYNTTISTNAQIKIVVDNIDLSTNVSAKFTCTSSESTKLCLQSVLLYSAPLAKQPVTTFKSTDKIAIIGNSWTQFPTTNHPVESDNPYNTVDTLANGDTAGGYCYLAKEIAHLTGCTVDNYGKSNMTSVYGLQQLAQEIVAQGKHYDYIIFEYYINDFNDANMSKDEWLANLAQIVKMAKSINARPIIMSPTSTNSVGQASGIMSSWYATLLNGLEL